MTGELRAVSQMGQRLSETARMGFKKCIIPKPIKNALVIPKGLEVLTAKTILDAIKIVL